jgi:hypothetical protein
MQGQDSPPRHLRNVPGFRDLRIGSPASWRSSLHRSQLNGESHSDLYELLDTSNAQSGQTATPRQPSPKVGTRAENGKLSGEAVYAETIVGRPAVPRSQRLVGSSEETLTGQPCRRAAIWKELWFPLLCIHGSMLLILGTVAVLVSIYRVKPERGLFFEPTGWDDSKQSAFILLSIPASMRGSRRCG